MYTIYVYCLFVHSRCVVFKSRSFYLLLGCAVLCTQWLHFDCNCIYASRNTQSAVWFRSLAWIFVCRCCCFLSLPRRYIAWSGQSPKRALCVSIKTKKWREKISQPVLHLNISSRQWKAFRSHSASICSVPLFALGSTEEQADSWNFFYSGCSQCNRSILPTKSCIFVLIDRCLADIFAAATALCHIVERRMVPFYEPLRTPSTYELNIRLQMNWKFFPWQIANVNGFSTNVLCYFPAIEWAFEIASGFGMFHFVSSFSLLMLALLVKHSTACSSRFLYCQRNISLVPYRFRYSTGPFEIKHYFILLAGIRGKNRLSNQPNWLLFAFRIRAHILYTATVNRVYECSTSR